MKPRINKNFTKMDVETGEVLSYSLVDAETGEYEGLSQKQFKIPTKYYNPETNNNSSKNTKILKADPYESQLITAVIYLLPTMILFHPILAIVASIIEIFLHAWSHKNNKTLKDENFYFQSPLHPYLKEFCGRCKDENSALKITKLQDLKREKLKNYIRRVVT